MTNIDSNDGKTPFTASSQFIGVNEGRVQLSERFTLTHRNPRVAVLIDGATGGSGEMLTAALTGRREARTFGTPTCGMAPFVGQAVKLRNGAELVLAGVVVSDRNGKRYPRSIEPDERIDDANAVIERALAWLASDK
jgi:C-terminal processing protease CtpA/Prc